MLVNNGITLPGYSMYITNTIYNVISSLNQLCSLAVIFLFCVEREDGATYFRAYVSQREFLLCVQMCSWVIWQLQSPCLVVASFLFLPFLYMYTYPNQVELCFQLLHIGGVIDVWSSYNDQQGSLYIVVVTASLSFMVSCYVPMHFELELSHGMIPEFVQFVYQ